MRKILYLLTGLVATVGLALGSAVAASAAPVPHAVVLGTAGIESFHSNPLQNIGAVLVAHPAFQNIGQVGTGGGGIQACDPTTGFALQEGLTADSAGTDSVRYAAGFLTGAAAKKCEGNGVFPAASAHSVDPSLNGIANGDPVSVFLQFRNVLVWHWHHGHCSGPVGDCDWIPGFWWSSWEGRATFQAYDWNTATFGEAVNVHTAADWGLHSAGAGVQQNTTGLSACPTVGDVDPLESPADDGGVPDPAAFTINLSDTGATEVGYDPAFGPAGSGACNLLLSISQVSTNRTNGMFDPFSGDGLAVTGAWVEVLTTAGGLLGNPALVATNGTFTPTGGSAPSSLDVFAANAF